MNIRLRPFEESEYHAFFKGYVSDPVMESRPYVYHPEAVSESYRYNYGVRDHYAHYGIFMEGRPVGCFQLKRIDPEKKCCEFGIILQNDAYKDRGIGTLAIEIGMRIAKVQYGMEVLLGDTFSNNLRMQRVFEKLGFDRIDRPSAPQRSYENEPAHEVLYYRKSLENINTEEAPA